MKYSVKWAALRIRKFVTQAKGSPSDCKSPVSYTHLDVYKRQGNNPMVGATVACAVAVNAAINE